ncbi:putative proline-rich receptor-like protein kinase PERK3 [Iris pallida]|nr:putative proline-rich receptor-like protein kinase PERK3 [Iris pallida]
MATRAVVRRTVSRRCRPVGGGRVLTSVADPEEGRHGHGGSAHRERDSATTGGRLGRSSSALERWIRCPALVVENARRRGVLLRAVLADVVELCWRLGPPALARR